MQGPGPQWYNELQLTTSQKDAMQNTTTLSIRLQQYPLWIIEADGSSTNLDVLADDLDLDTWIRANRDRYGIDMVLDENWIEFDMQDLYDDGGMGVDAYLWDNQYSYDDDDLYDY